MLKHILRKFDFTCSFVVNLYVQTIIGIVKDVEINMALIGASVSIEESIAGTQTNADGALSLNVKVGDYATNFRFVGYLALRLSVMYLMLLTSFISGMPHRTALTMVTMATTMPMMQRCLWVFHAPST